MSIKGGRPLDCERETNDPHFPHLSKVCCQPHLPTLSERTQDAGMADEKGDGALGDVLRTVIQKVQTLQRAEVVIHHASDEALQLTHVQRARHVRAANHG